FMATVHKYHAHNLRRIGESVEASQYTAGRLPHEHVRGPNARLVEEGAQLPHDLAHRSWARTQFAPPQAGTVVRTYAREAGDFWLDETPIHREPTGARIEDDRRLRRASLARAMKVDAPATEID